MKAVLFVEEIYLGLRMKLRNQMLKDRKFEVGTIIPLFVLLFSFNIRKSYFYIHTYTALWDVSISLALQSASLAS